MEVKKLYSMILSLKTETEINMYIKESTSWKWKKNKFFSNFKYTKKNRNGMYVLKCGKLGK